MIENNFKVSPAALRRAADWLQANPDKHISGHLAEDAKHRPLPSPFDPKAECFCAFGRYMVELGEPARIAYEHATPESRDLGVYQYIKQSYGVDFTEVYTRNDRKDHDRDVRKASPHVIPYLRGLANLIENGDAR